MKDTGPPAAERSETGRARHGFAEAQARFLFDTPPAFAASGQMRELPGGLPFSPAKWNAVDGRLHVELQPEHALSVGHCVEWPVATARAERCP